MILAPLAVLAAWGGLALAVTAPPGEWQRAVFGAALTGIGVGGVVSGFATYWEQLRSEKITVPGRPRVRAVRAGGRNPHLDKMAKSLARGRSADLLKAGVSTTPVAFYYRWVRLAAYALAGLAPAAVVLSFLLRSPLPLAAVLVPILILFMGPEFSLRSAAGDRKRGVEDELPFFAIYSTVMSSAGVAIYEAMRRLIGRGIYRRLESDAVYLVRSVEFMGEDQMSALDRLARSHPSRALRDFLYGYSSELRSGGDATSYLSGRAEELLRWLQFRFDRYADSVSDMGEMMTAMFFVLPAIVLTTAFIAPGASMGLVWMMAGLVIPIVGVMIAMIIRSNQPKTGDAFRGNTYAGLAAGIAAGVLSFIAGEAFGHGGVPLWAPLAAALVAGAFAFGMPVHGKLRAIAEEERSLPDFLRDVTELRKAGYTITRAIMAVAQEGKYSAPLQDYLRRVAAALRLGSRLDEVKVRANSWLANQVMFLLAQMEDSGGGTPRDLETLHGFMERYTMSKRMARSRMRLYTMLTFGTPAGLAFMIWIMATFLTRFKLPSLPGAPSILATSIPPSLFSASYVMVIVAAAMMALAAGTASDFTPLDTTRIAVSVLLAAAIVFLVSYYGGALSALLPTGVPGMPGVGGP